MNQAMPLGGCAANALKVHLNQREWARRNQYKKQKWSTAVKWLFIFAASTGFGDTGSCGTLVGERGFEPPAPRVPNAVLYQAEPFHRFSWSVGQHKLKQMNEEWELEMEWTNGLNGQI